MSQLAQLRSAKGQMLVLTPHGVVGRIGKSANAVFSSPAIVEPSWAWDGARDGHNFAFPYNRLKAVQLRTTSMLSETQVYLVLWLDSLRWLQSWRIDNRFSTAEIIAQRIIEAPARYAALQLPARD